MATNGKFAMAMPSAEKKKRMTYQPKHGHWRVNAKNGGRRGDMRPSQSLDDVKKLTRRGLAPFSLAPVPV